MKRKIKLTRVSTIHYVKLIYRSILFILALYWYISNKSNNFIISMSINNLINKNLNWIILFIAFVYTVEMILRLFPSNYESPGCQKQFKKNYKPTGRVDVILHDNNATVIAALLWIVLNGIFGILFMKGIFDEGIMFLICLVYGICDMVCILFFCPFQTYLFKNRCCVSCRIYNWDFAMMFTPLFFIPKIFSWWLLGFALVLTLKWEITLWKYPERFSENTNKYLECKNCTEKLCTHKEQLVSFKKGLKEYTEKQMKRILEEHN